MDDYLTKKQVQGYLQISPGTLQKLMKQRAFPYMKLQKKVLIRRSDIDKFMQSRMVK